jgi:hypothetical protein
MLEWTCILEGLAASILKLELKNDLEDGGMRFYRNAQRLLFTVLAQMSACGLVCVSHYDADGCQFVWKVMEFLVLGTYWKDNNSCRLHHPFSTFHIISLKLSLTDGTCCVKKTSNAQLKGCAVCYSLFPVVL